ncbi:hypothetical protein L1049_018413 [Liquidambar formosana]|uniref:Uncharacterized protein n=1 Tax=Liquidambar formosana TaxID=63359 RepID=A0AAP0RA27_LIQFO
MHACNARHLNDPVNEKPEKNFHLISKNDERVSHTKVSALPKSKHSVSEGHRELTSADSATEGSRPIDIAQKPKNLKAIRNESKGHHPKGKISGAVQSESFVSVSWHVPHDKKQGESQPGFNIDYSPPKTHPPSHN